MLVHLLVVSVLLHPFNGYSQTDDPNPEPHPNSASNLLQLMPPSATLAFALPSATSLYAKADMLEKRLSGMGPNLLSTIMIQTEHWIQPGGIPDAGALSALLQARGLDPRAPSAVFLDLTPAATRARNAIDLIASDDASWKTTPPRTRPTPDCGWLDFDLANTVVVMGCCNPDLARSAIERLATSLFGPEPPSTEPWEGLTIHTQGRVSYCVEGNRIFASNHAPMLKEALSLVATPPPLPVVNSEPSLYDAERIVLLTRMDKLRAMLPDLTALYQTSLGPEQDPAQTNDAVHYPVDAFSDQSPCITTLDVSETGIDVVSRLDLLAHPKFAEACGDASPIRLGAFLPEDCRVFFCVQWTDAGKALFNRRWGALLPGSGALNTLFGSLDGEMALGIRAPENGQPQLFLIAEIADPETVREGVRLSMPDSSWEEAAEIPGVQFCPLSSGACLALSGNTLMLGSDRQAAGSLAAAVNEGKRSAILASRTPPIASGTPIFGIISAQLDGLVTALRLLSSQFEGEPPEMFLGPLGRLSGVFREFRAGRNVADNWQRTCFALYFR
jgi:hypothetical protein